jgi:TonB-dependent receptor
MPSFAFAQQATVTTGTQAAPVSKESSPAKETKDPSDVTELGKISVSGYRYSIEKSLDQKREANAVVEVITAEDIGKFPDKNVADSLQRVPGVFITRDGGEGSRVSIRGLSPELVLTELNGNYVASSETNNEPTRSFNYVLLPSNMISSVEVFKSAEARIDEGGVGGTVILHTRRPLEMPANTGFATIEGTYADTTRQTDPQVSGLYSWHNKDETFGFLAGGTIQKRTTRTMEASTESWRWWQDPTDDNLPHSGRLATDVNGRPYANDSAISYWWGGGVYDQSGRHYSGYWAPQSVDFGVRNEDRKRTGVQLTTQFRPNDHLNLTANYFRFNLDGNYTLNLNKIPEWGYSDNPADNGKFLTGMSFDPSRSVATGANFMVPTGGCSLNTPPCTMETPQLSGVYSREKAKSQTFDLTAEFHSDFIDGEFKGGRTWSSGRP